MDFQKKESNIKRPFVTISYEVGAWGLSVVEKLCEYLQKIEINNEHVWKVMDKDLAEKVVEDVGLPKSSLHYLSESTASEIEDSLEYLVGLHPSRFTLVYNMNRLILRLAETGYVIIVGRGANVISSKLTQGIHVRLTGSMDNRIRYIKEHFNVGDLEAKKFIIKENRRRTKYFRKYFDRNINDSALYSMVINTDMLSVEDIVRVIGTLVYKNIRPL